MNVVETKNLTKFYGKECAVDKINFSINKGEIFGLLGPNGAGKTTTVSMFSCLIKPTDGDAIICGYSILSKSLDVKKRIGVVPQDIALYPTLTAKENLIFWGQMYGFYGKNLKNRVDEVLEIVSLKDRQNDLIKKYSGGMKRRINIAVGLLASPELLILDEPTVGVDPQSRINILETLKNLNSSGLTILYTSHYMEEVEFLCNTIAIMDLGKIIALGNLNELRILVGEKDKIIFSTINDIKEDIKIKISKIQEVDKINIFEKSLEVLTLQGRKILPEVTKILWDEGIRVKSVEIKEPDLETLFLSLTGKTLRE
ncbi:MAG TPA: ABC transporter ATP-binding protein [Caldisericia bacterium]|nr:ABC transporter ATP-binding protein [Caldisericia bacterium]HOL83296.1 ABC transporter ATP-binding protein [Caldisericia bacterium]HPC56992.1 ABC transporter ATP-binding protein [Caldisericia bacterium]HPP43882.1 ABC transporter ATP-binding protein [Caldisericia bacterium]HRU73973.1 ABC transporter ATP-binding protein [Caldisericia bacterium]